jgi:IMP dehydrogenase
VKAENNIKIFIAASIIPKLRWKELKGRVAYKGTIAEMTTQLVGGLRSGMGYTGCHSIQDQEKSRFIRITSAGLRESHVHDVIITKEAPNYRLE